MYTLAERGVVRNSDMKRIIPGGTPAEWAEYQQWLRSGSDQDPHIPQPMPVPAPELPTRDERIARLKNKIREHLDAAARLRDYDNIKSAALRAGYPGPRQAEGIAFAQWMDSCWDYVRQVRDDVINGNRTMPSAAALISELPDLTLPPP